MRDHRKWKVIIAPGYTWVPLHGLDSTPFATVLYDDHNEALSSADHLNDLCVLIELENGCTLLNEGFTAFIVAPA